MALPNAIIEQFVKVIGAENVFQDDLNLETHSTDYSQTAAFRPEVVLKPTTTEGVAGILKLCNAHRIPVTTQGGRSGVSGGALPLKGGVALSTERMNKILNIDTANFQVTVEPAVITEHLQNEVKKMGLFYPPDPAGRGWSFIGGNVATNAGGLKAVKYGVTREYVLNLEIVLPTGDILWTGANTLKNSTAYNLTHLIIGSEGTLAVITKIVLKLLPHPTCRLTLLTPFKDASDACTAVAAIFKSGVTPSALEYMDDNALRYALRYTGGSSIHFDLDIFKAYLLIEVDGTDMSILYNDCEKIASVLTQFETGDILYADNEAQQNELWLMRRNMANAVKTQTTIKLSEDTVVPRALLPDLLRGVNEIAQQHGLKTAHWGHLGDGNMHINLISEEPVTEVWLEAAHRAKKEIFQYVKSLNGMLSAEHGVGLVQKPYVPIFYPPVHIEILRGIKKVFDPNGILNPGKIFD